MNEKSYLEERLEDKEFSRRYAIEGALVDASEAVLEAMGEKGYNKTDMAEILEVKIAQVSRALNGSHNATIKTLASLLWACGRKLIIKSEPFKSFRQEITWQKGIVKDYEFFEEEIIPARVSTTRYRLDLPGVKDFNDGLAKVA